MCVHICVRLKIIYTHLHFTLAHWLERVKHCVGVRGKALEWFASYLSDRTFVVSADGVLLNVVPH